MSFTIASLVGDPISGMRIIAGENGASRVVAWAHTCELTDPWNWLGSGDLLMTDGYGFPTEPGEQVEFVRNLARVNIAGLALAEGFGAAEVTPQARAVADELAFPVMLTARSVPFVLIARLVADSNSSRSSVRLTRVLRVYDILRRAHLNDRNVSTLLDDLAREMKAELHVIDVVRGRDLMPTRNPIATEVRDAVLTKVTEHGGLLPAFSRVKIGTDTVLALPVGRNDTAALVLRVNPPDELPDLVLAQHVAMIAELDIERRAADSARARENRTALARRLFDGNLAPEAAASQLDGFGVGSGPWRVTAWETTDGDDEAGFTAELVQFDQPNLYLPIGDVQVLVLPEAGFSESLPSTLGVPGARAGASQPVLSSARFPDALREARWALEAARASRVPLAVYGQHGSYFMPRTVAEGEAIVSRLLGPILDYDARNDTQLLRSLEVFFEVNRSWQEGAKRLGIHKQTLAYRIKKVEDLTALDPRDFGSQAEFFYALRTWRLLNGK